MDTNFTRKSTTEKIGDRRYYKIKKVNTNVDTENEKYILYFDDGTTKFEEEITKEIAIVYHESCRKLEHKLRMADGRRRLKDPLGAIDIENVGDDSVRLEEEAIHNLEKSTLAEVMEEAIGLLSSKQQRRIRAYYYQQLTYEEIARIENCHHTSVKTTIDTGKKKLLKFLKRELYSTKK